MRRYRSGSRWTFWRWTEVRPEGEQADPYLTRLHIVQTPWFSVMVHWLWRPDPQPHMHDHPVSFWTFPLRGWYAQETPSGLQFVTRWRGRVMRAQADCHRIVALARRPTVTLVVAGPVVRAWGFHTPGGWIPWRQYTATFAKMLLQEEARKKPRHAATPDIDFCECHKKMGNDFWFLPTGSCLRPDKTCSSPARVHASDLS